MNYSHYILGDALTIPEGIWQAFLTILGAAIGALIAAQITNRSLKRKEFERARDDFDHVATKAITLFREQTRGVELWKNYNADLMEMERSVKIIKYHLKCGARRGFDEAWNKYENTNPNDLKPVDDTEPTTGARIHNYSKARLILTEPLQTMINLVREHRSSGRFGDLFD